MFRFLGAALAGAMVLATPSVAGATDAKIVRLYKTKCATCHGKDGKGQTTQGTKLKVRDMTTADFQKGTDAQWSTSILEGIKDKKKPAMKSKLTSEEVDVLIQYVRTFKP